MDSPVDRGAVKMKDPEEPLPVPDGFAAVGNGGGRGAASISIEIEDPEAAAGFEFRAMVSNATPPSTSRPSSRSRKQGGPMRFVTAGASEVAGSETPYSGASWSAPVIGPHEDVSVMADGDQGAAPGDDRKKKRACIASGSKVAIARATPPDSYRLVPSRSRKQSCPTRFIAGVNDASASSSSSSSYRLPSRIRKQPHPEHFIPEDSECVTADERGATGENTSSSAPATGCASPSATTTPGAPPREPDDGRRRVYGVLGVLGASLALSVVSCVLFYVVGQRSEPPGPFGEQLN